MMIRRAHPLPAACALLVGCVAAPNEPAAVTPLSTRPTPAETCAYDREKMLGLSQSAFDQDLDGGWRALSYRPGCKLAAADLIRDYRESKGLTASILYWHEGQLRASAGQTAQAIALFTKSRRDGNDPEGWDHYVDATIAFLKKDKSALLAARERLARIPRPADYQPPKLPPNVRLPSTWPPNLGAVDKLIRCFERDYQEAYHRCRK